MVAKVICGKNIRGAVAYNEHKVAQGVAECIIASKFGLNPDQLSLDQKVVRFEKLLALNRRVKTNAVHISLNFHKSDKLTKEQLSTIASDYIDRIGFGGQPYLVYEHRDAAHPHVHIITTNVTSTGKRIDLHNIGRGRSEEARKAIEKEYSLVQAEGRRMNETLETPRPLKPVQYGRLETKKAISDVVRYVTTQYRYSSLPELNAALSRFNVTAFPGYEGSKMHRNQGLVYSIVDDKGTRIGVPIKASSINGKPTLKALASQFQLGKILKKNEANRTKEIIEQILSSRRRINLETLRKKLNDRGIDLVIRKNDKGVVYGLTYVDHSNKIVFNGSELGKQFSAKGIGEWLADGASPKLNVGSDKEDGIDKVANQNEPFVQHSSNLELFNQLIKPEQSYEGSGNANMKRKRKKRKGKSI